jgi:hypothetical protein
VNGLVNDQVRAITQKEDTTLEIVWITPIGAVVSALAKIITPGRVRGRIRVDATPKIVRPPPPLPHGACTF